MAKKKCTLKGNARIEAIRELLQMSDSASMEDVRVGSFRPQGDADEILDLRSLALQRIFLSSEGDTMVRVTGSSSPGVEAYNVCSTSGVTGLTSRWQAARTMKNRTTCLQIFIIDTFS